MRKMATVRRIDAVNPIPNADAIEVATVGGWRVVIQKGEYQPGDLAVYCEIDSWIPNSLAPFLSKGKQLREFNGVKGERLRTIKLRGQLSQGLLLPLTVMTPEINELGEHLDNAEGFDCTEWLNIQKWEMPVPAQLAGEVRGNFPTAVPKTDQERVQNLSAEIAAAVAKNQRFVVTEKLEGSSMTVYQIHGQFGVCSRNLDLKENGSNSFWATARKDDIQAKMKAVDEFWDFAIQGELVGPGIQGNIYNLRELEFRVFDVYNIQAGEYLTPNARLALVNRMGLKHVPVLTVDKDLGIGTVDELLAWAEGPSALNEKVEREGIVFKEENGGFSFKAISNRYLLKSGD